MINIQSFTFNPFAENTYILFDETLECIIVDPGCYTKEEKKIVSDFILEHKLKPVKLLNTHCHIDHILGNQFIAQKYGLKLEIHKGEIPVLDSTEFVAKMYGLPNVELSPEPELFLEEDQVISFGNSNLHVKFTPGHSPASVSFYAQEDGFILGGDVLFQGSIGRTDLPGGDYDTLMKSIFDEFLSLPEDTIVYSGHGEATSIAHEKRNNPFIKSYK